MTKTDNKEVVAAAAKPKEENVEVIEDDEFEEFEDNIVEGEENSKEQQQWEDDWDTDNIDDDFSKQLRAEIESHSTMKS